MYQNDPYKTAWDFAAPYQDGEGDVTFHLSDGKEITFERVRVDSIGPSAENAGVIGVEYYNKDDIVHVPFVRYWTIGYRF
jgi:hypothetical protein